MIRSGRGGKSSIVAAVEGETDGSHDWCGGEEFLHGIKKDISGGENGHLNWSRLKFIFH